MITKAQKWSDQERQVAFLSIYFKPYFYISSSKWCHLESAKIFDKSSHWNMHVYWENFYLYHNYDFILDTYFKKKCKRSFHKIRFRFPLKIGKNSCNTKATQIVMYFKLCYFVVVILWHFSQKFRWSGGKWNFLWFSIFYWSYLRKSYLNMLS